MKEQGLQIAALEGSLDRTKQSALEEKHRLQQQMAALEQVRMLTVAHLESLHHKQ